MGRKQDIARPWPCPNVPLLGIDGEEGELMPVLLASLSLAFNVSPFLNETDFLTMTPPPNCEMYGMQKQDSLKLRRHLPFKTQFFIMRSKREKDLQWE